MLAALALLSLLSQAPPLGLSASADSSPWASLLAGVPSIIIDASGLSCWPNFTVENAAGNGLACPTAVSTLQVQGSLVMANGAPCWQPSAYTYTWQMVEIPLAGESGNLLSYALPEASADGIVAAWYAGTLLPFPALTGQMVQVALPAGWSMSDSVTLIWRSN